MYKFGLVFAALLLPLSTAKLALRTFPTSLPEAPAKCQPVSTPQQTYEVHATIYYPSGLPTASGKEICSRKATQHKWVAVSRDLHKKFKFGDYVIVRGISQELDGRYQVQDLMHPRWRRRIDILHAPCARLQNIGIWDKVTITKDRE